MINYIVKVNWPATCRNRNLETLNARPDLVETINNFRTKIANFCKAVCEKSFEVSDDYNMTGVKISFEHGPDVYKFILEQATLGYEVERTIYKYNILLKKHLSHKIVYTPNGITID